MKELFTYLKKRFGDRPGLTRAFRNFGWLFADRAARVLVGVVVTVLMARYLGPEGFGIISYALAITTICGSLALLGLKDVVIRDMVQDPSTAGTTLGSASGLIVIGGGAGYALLAACVLLTRPDEHVVQLVSLVIGASVLFRVSDFGSYWFESQVQSRNVVLAQLGVFLLASAAKILLIVFGAPLAAFVIVILMQFLASSLATVLVFRVLRPESARLRFDVNRAMSLFSASWPLLLSGAAMLIYMKIDQLMIASIWGDGAVGIYSAAVSVSEATYVIAVIIAATTFPAVISAKEEGDEIYRTRIQQLLDFMVLLSLVIAVPTTFMADWVIATLFGEAYHAAGIVLTIHIWASVFVFLGVVSNRWFVAEGLQSLNLQRTLLGAVLNIALNLVLIPRYELLGAAVATITAHGFAALFSDVINKQTRSLFRMKLHALNVPGGVMRLVRGF